MSIAEASFVLGEGIVRPGSAECICDWPDLCGGDGTLLCRGCNPPGSPRDCVCPCGGSQACFGCEDCEPDEQDD